MDNILSWDFQTFYFINNRLTNDLFDTILPLFRNKYFWTPFYVFLFSFFLINFKKKGLWYIVAIIILIAVTDQLSSHIIKPWVERLRPCNEPIMKGYVRLLVNCSHGFSFPSSHASNHFALAFFLIYLFFKENKWIFPIMFLWAFSISYAQVYVGVHYPLDVIAGANIGLVLGLGFGMLFKKYVLNEL